MNAEREKLLAKIQALLNKADTGRGATEEEAKAFLAKAQELMRKHGIEEMELGQLIGDEAAEIEVTEEVLRLNIRRRIVDQYVWEILEKCFDVKCIFSKHRLKPGGPDKMAYILIGDPLDVAFAKMSIPLIHRTMVTGLGLYLKSHGKTWTSTAEHSFCKGVTVGFIKESEQGKEMAMKVLSKEKKEQFGLILVNKQEAIAKFVADKHKNLKSATRGRQEDDWDLLAFEKGKKTGKDMDLKTNNKLK